MFCGITPGNNAHHIRKGTDGGMGLKPSDMYAVPICNTCHREIHMKGEVSFYKKHGYEVEDIITKAKKTWGERV